MQSVLLRSVACMSNRVFNRSTSVPQLLIFVFMLTSGGCLTSPFSQVNSIRLPAEKRLTSAERSEPMPKLVLVSENGGGAEEHTAADSAVPSLDALEYTSEPTLSSIDDLAKIKPSGPANDRDRGLLHRLAHDQMRFYTTDYLLPLGVAVGIGAAVANTQLDAQIQSHFRSSVLNASSDDWFQHLHASKELGNGVYTLPIFGAAWLANEWIDGPPIFEATGTWGERSMRGFLVGAPVVIAGQLLTGGSRPSELDTSSNWQPFQDNNGVSGHAFMSSLPFITAAKMTKNLWAKSAFYAGSAIGPLSRMNDNAHYPSQVGLGWCIAYLAASAVDQNATGSASAWTLKPLTTTNGSGIAAEYRW